MGLIAGLFSFIEKLQEQQRIERDAPIAAVIKQAEQKWKKKQQEAARVIVDLRDGRTDVRTGFRLCVGLISRDLLAELLERCSPEEMVSLVEITPGFESLIKLWPEKYIYPWLLRLHYEAIQITEAENGLPQYKKFHQKIWAECDQRIDNVVPHDRSKINSTSERDWQNWWWDYRIRRMNRRRAKKSCPKCGHSDELGKWVFFSCGDYGYKIQCSRCDAIVDYYTVGHICPDIS